MKLEASVRSFLDELRGSASRHRFMHYDRDKDVYERHPSNQFRGSFRRGWGRAQEFLRGSRNSYKPATLRRLTWCNLGYRFVRWHEGRELPDRGRAYGLLVKFSGPPIKARPARASESAAKGRDWKRPNAPMEHNARPADARLAHLARINKLEYQYRTRAANKRAARDEAELVQSYCGWSKDRKHKLGRVDFGKNGQCDLFEEERRNLLEAKCSASREHIRMAVGQLLDYAYLGRERFRGGPHMAILLPEKPDLKSLAWLREQRIWVVWREKGKFLDNASGQFV